MKNKEKFAKEIIEIACDGNGVAVCKVTGKPIACDDTGCNDCELSKSTDNGGTCNVALRNWAESEYIEKPVISKRDRAFLEYLEEEYKYMARDKNNVLYVYNKEPHKAENCTTWRVEQLGCYILNNHFNIDLPMIKWSDDKPWLIEDLKKLEVVEEYE